ncbi:unnamed protein product, partial [Effrenium voratum]
ADTVLHKLQLQPDNPEAVRRGLRSALCLVSTEVDAVLGFLRSHQAAWTAPGAAHAAAELLAELRKAPLSKERLRRVAAISSEAFVLSLAQGATPTAEACGQLLAHAVAAGSSLQGERETLLEIFLDLLQQKAPTLAQAEGAAKALASLLMQALCALCAFPAGAHCLAGARQCARAAAAGLLQAALQDGAVRSFFEDFAAVVAAASLEEHSPGASVLLTALLGSASVVLRSRGAGDAKVMCVKVLGRVAEELHQEAPRLCCSCQETSEKHGHDAPEIRENCDQCLLRWAAFEMTQRYSLTAPPAEPWLARFLLVESWQEAHRPSAALQLACWAEEEPRCPGGTELLRRAGAWVAGQSSARAVASDPPADPARAWRRALGAGAALRRQRLLQLAAQQLRSPRALLTLGCLDAPQNVKDMRRKAFSVDLTAIRLEAGVVPLRLARCLQATLIKRGGTIRVMAFSLKMALKGVQEASSVSEHGLRSVVAVLDHLESRTEDIEECLLKFNRLLTSTLSSKTLELIAASAFPQSIVKTIKRHLENPPIVAFACQCIARSATSVEAAGSFVRAGALDEAFAAMDAHKAHGGIQNVALFLLRNVLKDPNAARQAVAGGAITRVLAAMNLATGREIQFGGLVSLRLMMEASRANRYYWQESLKVARASIQEAGLQAKVNHQSDAALCQAADDVLALVIPRFKEVPCWHWQSGWCKMGPKCTYAHGSDDLRTYGKASGKGAYRRE